MSFTSRPRQLQPGSLVSETPKHAFSCKLLLNPLKRQRDWWTWLNAVWYQDFGVWSKSVGLLVDFSVLGINSLFRNRILHLNRCENQVRVLCSQQNGSAARGLSRVCCLGVCVALPIVSTASSCYGTFSALCESVWFCCTHGSFNNYSQAVLRVLTWKQVLHYSLNWSNFNKVRKTSWKQHECNLQRKQSKHRCQSVFQQEGRKNFSPHIASLYRTLN